MHSLIHVIDRLKQSEGPATAVNLPKAIAENIFNELRLSGLRDRDIVAVSSELIGQLTTDIVARQNQLSEESKAAN